MRKYQVNELHHKNACFHLQNLFVFKVSIGKDIYDAAKDLDFN